jgi:cyclopropane fatty-acyl-phospholipid synthase-like methyltransferase
VIGDGAALEGPAGGSTRAAAPPIGDADVARYYDRNTGRFLLMGRGRVYGIHRELWGPGATTAEDAAAHIDDLLAAELVDVAARPAALVLDFGCGVGGTLFRLAEHLPTARFHGVTISRRQVDVAERLAERLGRVARCSFTHGDFHAIDLSETADAIVAIESFAHSGDPGAFLASASRHLEKSGRLLIADDFLVRDESALAAAERDLVDRLRKGWRVPGIRTAGDLEREAPAHGFALEKSVDLTPLTRPGTRLRDRLGAVVTPALVGLDATFAISRMPFFGNLIGGHAVQAGLREGILEYRLLVFRKIA